MLIVILANQLQTANEYQSYRINIPVGWAGALVQWLRVLLGMYSPQRKRQQDITPFSVGYSCLKIVYFQFFQAPIQFLQQIIVKMIRLICNAGIRFHDLWNLHESPSITSRAGLLPNYITKDLPIEETLLRYPVYPHFVPCIVGRQVGRQRITFLSLRRVSASNQALIEKSFYTMFTKQPNYVHTTYLPTYI